MEKEMGYTLYSKNKPLAKFSLFSETVTLDDITEKEYSIRLDKIYNENQNIFPKELENPTDETLARWISHRKVPKNRAFVANILNSIEDSRNPMRYADVTYALSLNDAFWIKPDWANTNWESCNLYAHPFDERLAQVAFTGYSRKITGVITTPETTASGALKKCWQHRESGIYLMKGDSTLLGIERNEALMEYYAAQIADIMQFDHVPYDIERFTHSDGTQEAVCTCPLFTSESQGYVNAVTYFAAKGYDVSHMDLESRITQQKLAKAFGETAYADMMVFDSLIGNIDRHLGNFGYIVDNDTGAFLHPAPIFDNGRSLLFSVSNQELSDMELFGKQKQTAMMHFDDAAEMFLQQRHKESLRKLTAFVFKRHPSCQVISEESMKKMDFFIQTRAKKLLEISRKKEKAKKIHRNNEISR